MSRQCPNHYAFRAGQNLPDKEFRYLRTVIVTAAVHWGFGSMLRLRLHFPLTFQHWAGVSSYTSSFDFAETCVFVKQLLGPFHCDIYLYRLPFSLSYGVNLPSSLTMFISLTWKFSFFLPVSVYGTSTSMLLYGFSCHLLWILHYYFSLHLAVRTFPFARLSSKDASPYIQYISVVQESFTCFPSTTLFSLALGPDLPWADEPSSGNLRFSVGWILTILSLLIPAFSLVYRPLLFAV